MVKGVHVASPARSAFATNALATNYGVAKPNAVQKFTSWLKPYPGPYKLNVDASYYPPKRIGVHRADGMFIGNI